MALPLERIEGKYEIVAKIHEGGMGAVYRVRHRLLDEIRVIKILRPRFAEDRELSERFVDEARAAIRLRHPNVVQVYDFTLDEDGVGILVMEHIEGVNLHQLRALGPPSVALGAEIAHQSLRALGYLHRRGFVHRDVSPDNLMLTLDPDGQPLIKVIDLGIAKDQQAELHRTESGVFLGKFRYASPEHFAAEDPAHVGPRSDLYALGVVLYELLTGRLPIRGTEAASLIAGHLFREPYPFSETDPDERLPAPLRILLLRAIAKKPEDRFADAEAMVDALKLIRASCPLDDAARREAIDRVAERVSTDVDTTVGSTQIRLDADFDLVSTPAPAPAPLTRQTISSPQPGLVSGSGSEAQPATDVARSSAAPDDERLDHDHPFDRSVAAGCTCAASGDFAGAVEAFGQALEQRPDSFAVRLLLEEAQANLAAQSATGPSKTSTSDEAEGPA